MDLGQSSLDRIEVRCARVQNTTTATDLRAHELFEALSSRPRARAE